MLEVFKNPLYFLAIVIFFLERGEGREKGKERNINVREKHQLGPGHTPGMCPDRESNPDLSLHGWLNQLSHNGQGKNFFPYFSV